MAVTHATFFTSGRERRLWLWAVVVLVAIYSTLGPARALAVALREHNLLRVSLVFALLAVLAVVAWRWIKRRPRWGEIGVALVITAAYSMTFIRMRSWEERTHLIEYGLVAILVYRALCERRRNGRRVPAPAALTVVLTALLGLLDESIQALLPDRVYDIRDVGFNALAGLMAITASLALALARRWGRRLTAPPAPR